MVPHRFSISLVCMSLLAAAVLVERVSCPAGQAPDKTAQAQAGIDRLERIRAAKMPEITRPVPFDTPEADAILEALEVFPPDNPWNQPVDDWPTHPDSKAIVATIGVDKPLRHNEDMGFILVPPGQKRVDFEVALYPEEADAGPHPIPDDVPIEGWPAAYQRDTRLKRLTLDQVQRDTANKGGDRHALVVDPVNRMLYEFFQMKKTDKGWQGFAVVFDLKSNRMRPDDWTSADAAGLPIFPAVVRHDELARGRIDHALRVTVRFTQRACVYPATHFASRLVDPRLPRMGERLRLRRDFDTSRFSPNVRVVLEALQRYGMFVADNGLEWSVSVAPDPRIPPMHEELRKVKGADFEVVVPPEGYRRPE